MQIKSQAGRTKALDVHFSVEIDSCLLPNNLSFMVPSSHSVVFIQNRRGGMSFQIQSKARTLHFIFQK